MLILYNKTILKTHNQTKQTKQTMKTLPQAPHNIVLFNIASRTLIGLTPEDEKKVYAQIESTMNGDGLYEGATKETILQAYHDQELGDSYGLNWVDHISHILHDLGIIERYIKPYILEP